jgi:AraC-like DNA-binding protein
MIKKTNYENINLKEISPSIKSSYFFSPDPSYHKRQILEHRFIEYYEIEFIIESQGSMLIDGKNYKISKNDIVFRKPGQTTQGILPYDCYAIIFELKSKSEKYYKNEIIDSIPVIFNTKFPDRYIPFFESVIKEYINPSTMADILFKINILQIIYLAYLEVSNPLKSGLLTNSGVRSSIKNALDFIDSNWNKPFSIDELASYAKFSKNHFIKVFTSTIGITPNNYITDYRIQKSKEFLAMTNLSIVKIAMKCGYDNSPYFSYLFKKKTGNTPTEFRKLHSYI